MNGPLTAPDSASSGGNGVYGIGSSGTFPTSSASSPNFWVDVIFSPTGSPTLTPTFTPTATAITPTRMNTPTPTQTNTPTITPTPIPSFTNIRLNGTHSAYKALMFWIIFNESSSDIFDSGSPVDNFDLGSSRFSSFLFTNPYCSIGSGPGDNAIEAPNSSGHWYIRHCPYDYRYMASQTIMNGFLNYERRYSLSQIFEYATSNFSSSIGLSSNSLWAISSSCTSNSFGTSYAAALASSSVSTSYVNAVGWLNQYLACLSNLNQSSYSIDRVKRAYNYTIRSQIQQAVNDFEGTPQNDPTNAAFQLKAVNYGTNRTLVTCVGGCYIQGRTGIVYTFEAQAEVFQGFAKTINNISQSDINSEYVKHIQQINPYIASFNSVVQPVLVFSGNQGSLAGYLWLSAVYQQSDNMIHRPR